MYDWNMNARDAIAEKIAKEARNRIAEYFPGFANSLQRERCKKACEYSIRTATKRILNGEYGALSVLLSKAKDPKNTDQQLFALQPRYRNISKNISFGYSAVLRRKDISTIWVSVKCWNSNFITTEKGLLIPKKIKDTELEVKFRIPAHLWISYLKKIEKERYLLLQNQTSYILKTIRQR